MALFISPKVKAKLAQKEPPVAQEEIEQCFANRTGAYLMDTREQHQSDPPTLWFIAETDYGRRLKIAFIQKDDTIHIRTAYDPNDKELEIFEIHSDPL